MVQDNSNRHDHFWSAPQFYVTAEWQYIQEHDCLLRCDLASMCNQNYIKNADYYNINSILSNN